MPDPMTPERLAEIRERVDRLTASGARPEVSLALLDEIDRLRAERTDAVKAMAEARRKAKDAMDRRDQLTVENAHLRENGCAHVVTTDEGTSHCGLAVEWMDKAIAQIERLRAERDDARREAERLREDELITALREATSDDV